jgi:hypothetical protein
LTWTTNDPLVRFSMTDARPAPRHTSLSGGRDKAFAPEIDGNAIPSYDGGWKAAEQRIVLNSQA